MELNATERRTLVLATGLILAGAAVRIATAPDPAEFGWMPAAEMSADAADVDELRESVQAAIERRDEAERPLAPGEKIDPNTASVEQLDRLPGVGPVTAEAIVRHREAGIGFGSARDLEAVPGVGPALSSRLSGYLAFRAAPSTGRAVPEPVRIDVNRAQPEELQQITGIGPALAQRIIQVRVRLGRFQAPEDLLLVPGIGPVTLAKIRDQVRFE
jgi:competence protein ComEA